jgi:gluconokinase
VAEPGEPPTAVVMGVSGSGKTTVGVALAKRLGWPFVDGDALHPPANVAKMAAGMPLTDDDRWPWLHAIAAWLDERRAAGESGVVACSALRRRYRDVLRLNRPAMRVVYLKGSPELIAERLRTRQGHFFPAKLLADQLAALEEPEPDERPIVVGIESPPTEIVDRVAAELTAARR